jgi:hypothetical protein
MVLMSFYPNADFALQDTADLGRSMFELLSQREPFSLVRIGATEGHLLNLSDEYSADGIKYFEGYFGDFVDVSYLREMRDRLAPVRALSVCVTIW